MKTPTLAELDRAGHTLNADPRNAKTVVELEVMLTRAGCQPIERSNADVAFGIITGLQIAEDRLKQLKENFSGSVTRVH
jgi:hypothetical protein